MWLQDFYGISDWTYVECPSGGTVTAVSLSGMDVALLDADTFIETLRGMDDAPSGR